MIFTILKWMVSVFTTIKSDPEKKKKKKSRTAAERILLQQAAVVSDASDSMSGELY